MSAAKTILCRFLIALTAWTPFQIAHAGMIGAGPALAAEQTEPGARDAVSGFLARADVARQLQALGIDAAAARERAAALSDADLRAIAGEVRGLPAGGDAGGIIVWILVIWLVWYMFWRKPQS